MCIRIQCGQPVNTILHNEPRLEWRQDFRYSNVSLINGTNKENYPAPFEGHCYFNCPLNTSELEQAISVRNYSLLIDNNQASFHLSAFFGCPSRFGQAYIEYGFYTDQLILAAGLPTKVCQSLDICLTISINFTSLFLFRF